MATPVFKFRHPEFPDFDLYFIQNTFYELPETIPMDLTTFIIYHMKSKRTLSGFFLCWDNLEKRGSSMDDVNFESWFNEEEKMTLYQDAIYSRAIEKAIENRAYSQQIRNLITLNHATNAYRQVAGLLHEMGYPANSNFINISYYYSRHHLMDYIYTTSQKYLDVYDQEETLAALYKSSSFPLHLIPHKFRITGFFHDECVRRKKQYLIPGWKPANSTGEDLHLSKRVTPEKFTLKKHGSPLILSAEDADHELVRHYLYQVLTAPFVFSNELKENFFKICRNPGGFLPDSASDDSLGLNHLPWYFDLPEFNQEISSESVYVLPENYEYKENNNDYSDTDRSEAIMTDDEASRSLDSEHYVSAAGNQVDVNTETFKTHVYLNGIYESDEPFDDHDSTKDRNLKSLIWGLSYDVICDFLETEALLPQYFYYFDPPHSDIGIIDPYGKEVSERYGKIYTDIYRMTYDEGGLVVMECFTKQIYMLCDADGIELSDYCHDLEIGVNGLIISRSLSRNDDNWKIQKFDLFKGFLDDYSKDYTAFLEEFLEATGYLKYRDLHPLLHEDINVEDKTHSGHAADSIEMVWEILKNDDDDKKTWITAPWLLHYYYQDIQLAKWAVLSDYTVYTLLPRKMQLHEDIIRAFKIKAPLPFLQMTRYALGLPQISQ